MCNVVYTLRVKGEINNNLIIKKFKNVTVIIKKIYDITVGLGYLSNWLPKYWVIFFIKLKH